MRPLGVGHRCDRRDCALNRHPLAHGAAPLGSLAYAQLDLLAGGKGWCFVGDSGQWQSEQLPKMHFADLPAISYKALRWPLFAAVALVVTLALPQALARVHRPRTPAAGAIGAHGTAPAATRRGKAAAARGHRRNPQQLNKLKENDEGFDGSAWQSLDRLAQRMEQQAQDQAQRLGNAQAAVAQMAAAAQQAQ